MCVFTRELATCSQARKQGESTANAHHTPSNRMTGLSSVLNTLFSTEEGGNKRRSTAAEAEADSSVGAAVPVDEDIDSPRAEQSVLPFVEATNA